VGDHVALSAGTGTWRDAYARRGRKYTAVHEGGPADGAELAVIGTPLPQTRLYATEAARQGKVVVLHRYVLFVLPAIDRAVYTYSGTTEQAGPVAGQKENPAWS
jgi:hypothetical protein